MTLQASLLTNIKSISWFIPIILVALRKGSLGSSKKRGLSLESRRGRDEGERYRMGNGEGRFEPGPGLGDKNRSHPVAFYIWDGMLFGGTRLDDDFFLFLNTYIFVWKLYVFS